VKKVAQKKWVSAIALAGVFEQLQCRIADAKRTLEVRAMIGRIAV
jgi:hypothetical protein